MVEMVDISTTFLQYKECFKVDIKVSVWQDNPPWSILLLVCWWLYVSGAEWWCGIGEVVVVVVVVVAVVYTILSWTGPVCAPSAQLSPGWREENK